MTTTNHRLRAALLACGLLAGCGPADPDSAVDAAPAAAATSAVDAPMQPKAAPAMPARVIAGRYIVTFSAAVADPAAEARDLVARAGGTLHFTYGRALRGFAASLPDAGVAALRGNPRIASVEADQVVSIGAAVQNWATWGLDRVDQRALPLDKDYRFGASGAGVTAFVIDTGIRPTHAEFRDGTDSSFLRVLPGYSAIADDNGTRDCHGHGTHVAGTIGGLSYGVAKQVMLVPVRVLDCTGSGAWSGVIAGLDHVARSSARPAVANLSLGGGASSSLDTAIANTVAAGVTVVVAAGNSNADACTMSPARAPSAITVGASTREDARAPYSNYGPCLDLFAPGSDIASSLADGDTAVGIASGTSMAAPHVAGAAALVLQDAPSLAPGAVWDRLKALATPDRVASAGTGSPNRLLYTNPDAEPAPPPGTMSVAALTGSATVTSTANWRATVAIDVRDGSGRALANVRVTGGFTVGGDPLACTTAANGRCSVTSASLSRKSVSATRFAVSSLSGAGLLYDPAANAAGSITVLRP